MLWRADPMRITGPEIKHLIDLALSEDIGGGDVTSEALLENRPAGKAVIVAKQEGVVAGLPVAGMVFRAVNPKLVLKMFKRDGDRIRRGEKIVSVRGKIRGILSAERTALNFLQRLSGIATLTSKYVDEVKGTGTRILDTRKTTPGLRVLEKYAVKTGGGQNHRMGLFDMILIKENHIQAAGGVSKAIQRARSKRRKEKVEVEIRNLAEAREAVKSKPDWIMLDNMRSDRMRKAVELIRSADRAIKIEASGSVGLKNVRRIALTGVDFISVGALTHSAPALDMSLILIEP
jgi:nicotinate-nucleotide pyrophosphorylase (carboxylating)